MVAGCAGLVRIWKAGTYSAPSTASRSPSPAAQGRNPFGLISLSDHLQRRGVCGSLTDTLRGPTPGSSPAQGGGGTVKRWRGRHAPRLGPRFRDRRDSELLLCSGQLSLSRTILLPPGGVVS